VIRNEGPAVLGAADVSARDVPARSVRGGVSMNEWTIRDHSRGRDLHKDSRAEGENTLEEFEGELELELIDPNGNTVAKNFGEDVTGDVEPEMVDHSEPEQEDAKADGGAVEAEVVQDDQPEPEPPEPQSDEVITGVDDLRENHADLLAADVDPNKDPNNWLPSWMLTEIDHGGQTSVDLNKRGTQVVSKALDVVPNAECVVEAHETDFEYAKYKATVERPNGDTYTAVGDAHIDESGNEKWDLERLAETRAKKRAVKWATGGGLEAIAQDEVSGQ